MFISTFKLIAFSNSFSAAAAWPNSKYTLPNKTRASPLFKSLLTAFFKSITASAFLFC